MAAIRGNWGSKLGFILAAAGSAVGLGNIWKFPYVVGENGGGIFVLIYLVCVVLVGLPIMVSEVLIGRSTQKSPVAAFREVAAHGSPWVLTGWMGLAAGFFILSFYSVVAGWTLHYVYLSASDAFSARSGGEIAGLFSALYQNPRQNLVYHAVFMVMTVSVVLGGVQAGIERWARILMPSLLLMLVGLMLYSVSLSGFGQAMSFLFAPNPDKFKAGSVLEAMGQAFFSLSLGMGAMLTYGSYLKRDTGIVKTSLWVASLDTFIALMAGVVVFPIIFSSQLEAGAGPGLVFQSIPIAFSKMPGGQSLSVIFFVLLVFAALTSSISLMEVVTASFIDLYGWARKKVALVFGFVIFIFGVPSALSGGKGLFGAVMAEATGRNFFDWVDHLASNLMLPLGGLLFALYVGWFMDKQLRQREFARGTTWQGVYHLWLGLLRYLVPAAVSLVFGHSSGLLGLLGIKL